MNTIHSTTCRPLLFRRSGLFLVLAAAFATAPLVMGSGSFVLTGSMSAFRATGHTATLLNDGRVLVAGGFYATVLKSAEIYDPTTGTWSNTGNLVTARGGHTANLLPDGKVLIAGGDGGGSLPRPMASAEIYDPATGTWSATGSMEFPREDHTATSLPDGRVVVAGGTVNFDDGLNTAEVYDPATGTWSETGNLNDGRWLHVAGLLPDGTVLVAGGAGPGRAQLASAEIYNPTTGQWTFTGSLAMARWLHAGAVLADGRFLVAGGDRQPAYNPIAQAEIYDPSTGRWQSGGTTKGRVGPTVTLLAHGRVLEAGGSNRAGRPFSDAFVGDPRHSSWATVGDLMVKRENHTATLLNDGSVLIAGGTGGSSQLPVALKSAELFHSTGDN